MRAEQNVIHSCMCTSTHSLSNRRRKLLINLALRCAPPRSPPTIPTQQRRRQKHVRHAGPRQPRRHVSQGQSLRVEPPRHVLEHPSQGFERHVGAHRTWPRRTAQVLDAQLKRSEVRALKGCFVGGWGGEVLKVGKAGTQAMHEGGHDGGVPEAVRWGIVGGGWRSTLDRGTQQRYQILNTKC